MCMCILPYFSIIAIELLDLELLYLKHDAIITMKTNLKYILEIKL